MFSGLKDGYSSNVSVFLSLGYCICIKKQLTFFLAVFRNRLFRTFFRGRVTVTEETDCICQAYGLMGELHSKREKIPSGTETALKMEQQQSQDMAVTSALHSCGDTRVIGWRSLAQPLLTAMVPDEFLLSVLVLLLVCLGVSAHSLLFQRGVEITIHSANKHLESPHKHKGCLS